MATSEVDIYNLALSAAGINSLVSAPTEDSPEANACNLWFPVVRDQVLHAAPWPSARTFSRLGVLAERDFDEAWATGAPEPGLRYAYAAPSDMLRPRYLTTFDRFTIALHNDTAKAIMTDVEDAILIYTKKQTTISLWDPELRFAIIYALAANITLPLEGKMARANSLADRANEAIIAARVSAANSDEYSFDTIPDWIAARGYAGTVSPSRYIHPHGSLISIGSLASAN